MFYLKASLIFSAVSALPLSQLNTRQTGGGLIQPELIPGACSWQCNPIISIADTCQGDDTCPCTAIAATQLQYCLNCYWTQNSQVPGDGSWMISATEWANNFNLQCRQAGVDVPAVVAGGNDLAAVNSVRANDATDQGSPAVPRVGSLPALNTPTPAAPAPASPTTPPTPAAPSEPSQTPSTGTTSSQTLIFTPPPPASSTLTISQTPSPSAPGLGSTINLGSQTITVVGSSVPINIPVNNASSAASAAQEAADNAAHRSMADVWIAVIAGTISVMAAVMF